MSYTKNVLIISDPDATGNYTEKVLAVNTIDVDGYATANAGDVPTLQGDGSIAWEAGGEAGAIVLQGTWDADTNTPDISGTTETGYAWIVSVAGATDLGGITDWKVNDIAVKTATGWAKIDNTDAAGGNDTEVQFNDGGLLAGIAALTWTGTVLTLADAGSLIPLGAGTDTVKIGAGAAAAENNSIAIGHDASVAGGGIGIDGVAIGRGALVQGDGTVAIGAGTQGYNPHSVVIGDTAVGGGASTGFTVSIGYGSNCGRDYAVAIGYGAQGSGENAVAIGKSANTGGGNYNVAIGDGAQGAGDGAVAIGRNTLAGFGDIAIGDGASTSGSTRGIAIGEGAQASGDKAVSLGDGASGQGLALGGGAYASGPDDMAIGYGAQASSYSGGVAIGKSASESSGFGVAIGGGAICDQGYSVVLGYNANSDDSNQLMIGAGTNINAMKFGAGVHDVTFSNPFKLASGTSVNNISTDGTFATGATDNDVKTAAAIKTYVDNAVTGALTYQGGYDANTNTPDLTTPAPGAVTKGHTYTVTADGSFFTTTLESGDMLIAEIDDPSAEADWTIVEKNLTGAVSGPGSSTDNALPRFDGTSGYAVQSSSVLIDDSNNMTGVVSITSAGGKSFVTRSGGLTENSLVYANASNELVSAGITYTNVVQSLATLTSNEIVVGAGTKLATSSGKRIDDAAGAGSNILWSAQKVDSDYVAKATVNAKGDLLAATADDTVARKAVGADGTVLAAASGESDGLDYQTVAEAANINPGVTALTISGGAVTPDAAAGQVNTVNVSENLIVNAPTNPVNGAKLMIRFTQTGAGAFTVTLNSVFTEGDAVSFGASGAATGDIHYSGWIYDSTDAKWHLIADAGGF